MTFFRVSLFWSFLAAKLSNVSGFGISPSVLENVAFVPLQLGSSLNDNSFLSHEVLSPTTTSAVWNNDPPLSFVDSVFTTTTSSHILLGNAFFPIVNPSSVAGQVGDGVRSIAFGIATFAVLIVIVSQIYFTFFLPSQVEELVEEMKQNNPDVYEEKIGSQLKEGETLMERMDLLYELVDIFMNMALEEDETEMKRAIELLDQNVASGNMPEDVRPELETKLGMSIEEYVRLIDLDVKKEQDFNIPTIASPSDIELCQRLKEVYMVDTPKTDNTKQL